MADIYINADSGDDGTGDGSSGLPYETLAHAYDQSSAGDTIICQDSTATYSMPAEIFSQNITIQGESDDASGAVFDAGGGNGRWEAQSSSAITVKKLTFTNSSLTSNWDGMFEVFDYCSFSFTNCIFHNITVTLSDVSGLASVFQHKYSDSTDNGFTLKNCLVYNIKRGNAGASKHSLFGIGNGTNPTITITNCVFDMSVDSGNALNSFLLDKMTTTNRTVEIKNSIFYDESGTFNWGDPNPTSASYNCYYNFEDRGGTGSITSDPLFADQSNNNYKLQPTSPCIDTGVLI